MKKIKEFFNKIYNSKAMKIILACLFTIGVVITSIFFVVLGKKSKWIIDLKKNKAYEEEVKKAKDDNEKVVSKAKKTSEKSKKVVKENGLDIKKIENKQDEIDKGVKKYYRVIDTSKKED